MIVNIIITMVEGLQRAATCFTVLSKYFCDVMENKLLWYFLCLPWDLLPGSVVTVSVDCYIGSYDDMMPGSTWLTEGNIWTCFYKYWTCYSQDVDWAFLWLCLSMIDLQKLPSWVLTLNCFRVSKRQPRPLCSSTSFQPWGSGGWSIYWRGW